MPLLLDAPVTTWRARMKITTVLVVSTFILSAVLLTRSPIQNASADPLHKPGISVPAFYQLDRNSDGMLSFIEARLNKTLGMGFYRIDLDQDGIISPQELLPLHV